MRDLQSFLEEDEMLTKKISYEEFINGALKPQNSDFTFREALDEYKRTIEQLKVAQNG